MNTNDNYIEECRDISYGQTSYKNNKVNGMSVAGLIIGIVGIIGCLYLGLLGIFFGGIALFFSILGYKQKKCGVAIAAIVTTACAITIGAIRTIVEIITFFLLVEFFQWIGGI